MLENLLKQYGSAKLIPIEKLIEIGYERILHDGAQIIRRSGAVESDPHATLEKKVAKLIGIESTRLSDVPSGALRRVQQVMKHLLDTDKKLGPDGATTLTSDFRRFIAAWAKDGAASTFHKKYKPVQRAKKKFANMRIDAEVWHRGIESSYVNVEAADEAPASNRFRTHLDEFVWAVRSFLKTELRQPQPCLNELASKLGTSNSTIAAIIGAITYEAALRKSLHIVIERGKRKNALNNGTHIGFFHLQEIQKALSRQEKHASGAYEIRLAKKNPFTDLNIGNDGGCCIGVYFENELHGAVGHEEMPKYLLDPATQFVEVLHGHERCGMALLFAGENSDGAVLIVNSIELNSKLGNVAETIVNTVLAWCQSYATAAGFNDAVMGSHDYNTGITHTVRGADSLLPITGIEKFDFFENEIMHGDVFEDYPYVKNVVRIRDLLETTQPKVAELFDHARHWFDVVIGPKEFKNEGLHISKWPVDNVDIAMIDSFIREVQVDYGLKPHEKIPAIMFVSLVPLKAMRKSYSYSFDDLMFSNKIGKCPDRRDPVLVLMTIKPIPLSGSTKPDEPKDAAIRSEGLLWAHRLEHLVVNRFEKVVYSIGPSPSDHDLGTMRFQDGTCTSTKSQKKTTGYLIRVFE